MMSLQCVEKKFRPKCEHGKQKSHCKDCGGSSFCEHGKRKYRCKDCGGSSICEHGKERSHCKDCGGSSFCEHGKQRSRCKDCGGSALCKTPFCETRGQKKYNGFCLPCCVQVCPDIKVARNYKTKEKHVVDRIKETFPNFTWVADKSVKNGCSNRRPDLLLDMGSHIIIVEVDENKHTSYECSCENKRLMLISQDVGHRPIVFIRFNPDGYQSTEGPIRSCWKLNMLGVMTILKTKMEEWEHRLDCLLKQIEYWTEHKTCKTIEIIELFY